MEAEGPPTAPAYVETETFHKVLKTLLASINELKERMVSIELQLVSATHRPEDFHLRQPPQAPEAQPQVPQVSQQATPTEPWVTVTRKSASKRPAPRPNAGAPPFDPFGPLQTISEERNQNLNAATSKKARTQVSPPRTTPMEVNPAPGPSRSQNPTKGKNPPNQGQSRPKKGGPTPSSVTTAKGPTPGPKKANSGSTKSSKKDASKALPSVASSAAPKKGKAQKPSKFRDVAMASPPSLTGTSQRPTTFSEAVLQVQNQVPQVPQVLNQADTSTEAVPQVVHQVHQVIEDTQDPSTSTEVDNQVEFQVPQVTQDEDMEETTLVPPTARRRVPPIIIRDSSKWVQVGNFMKVERINFRSAVPCSDGVRVQTGTSDDYRSLVKLLDRLGVAYHTYTLEENKTLRAVLRMVPVGITSAQVRDDLEAQGFEPIQVTRMVRGRKPMPLVLVEVPKTKGNIFDIKRVCGLSVKAEKQVKPNTASQCHSCQGFHHCARNCRAQFRCVKCAGNHHSRDCEKEYGTPAKCANCGGSHTANYGGCPRFPREKGQGKAKGKPRGHPKAANAKPKSTSVPASGGLTARQQSDFQLRTKEINRAVANAKDPKSLAKVLADHFKLLIN